MSIATFPARRSGKQRHRRHRPLRPSSPATQRPTTQPGTQSPAPNQPQSRPTQPAKQYDDMEPEADAFASGDPEAFGLLCERYKKRLANIARRRLERDLEYNETANDADINDLLQETFTRLWQYRESSWYVKRSSVYVWLRACVSYTHHSRRRDASRYKRRPRGKIDSLERLADEVNLVAVDDSQPDARAIREETREVLVKAATESTLPPNYLETVLASLDGLEPREIAEREGITRQSVNYRLRYSVEAMTDFVIPALCGGPKPNRAGIEAAKRRKDATRCMSDMQTAILHLASSSNVTYKHIRDTQYGRYLTDRARARASECVSRSVRTLESRGLVSRVPLPGKRTAVAITDLGREVLPFLATSPEELTTV